jgi:hypothetical protein
MLLLLIVGVILELHGAHWQATPPAKPVARSCPNSWNDAPRGGKKALSSKKRPAPSKSGACIELTFSALDIQEYLQSHSRKENWGITDDQLTEDSWTFSLDLSKEDMLRDTSIESRPKGVEWTAGSVRVNINTLELPDGLVRATVHALFRGYGRNADQFATHKEYWELESSNAFENSVVSGLRIHFSELSATSKTPVAP